jgi:hypothetical protein
VILDIMARDVMRRKLTVHEYYFTGCIALALAITNILLAN